MVLMDDPGRGARCVRFRRSAHAVGNGGHDDAVRAGTHDAIPARRLALCSKSTGPAAATASSSATTSVRRDLKGKTITLAQNSPSEYYLTSLLLSAGLRPSDVKVKYTATAFEAAAAFVADKNVDACVSWAPDIYKIPERVAGTRILSSTADANKLIADVYAFRADFARDHPEVVEGLVAGIFEGMDMVKEKPEEPAKWMADAFGMKPDEVMGMRNDSHPTNFAENIQFFLNASNPTNFERTWKNSAYVYRELGRINAPIEFDQVMDFSVIQSLQKKGTFAHQADESVASFTPASFRKTPAEAPILTQTIRINFYPNSANPYEPARDESREVRYRASFTIPMWMQPWSRSRGFPVSSPAP